MISVNEISRLTDKKNKLRKDTYIKIFEQVSRKIRLSVDFGSKFTVFQVPSFLIGHPMFDRYKATTYIKRQLERGGFEVVITGDHELHITWKIKKVSENKVESENALEDFPTLINLKKAANKYRRHAEKS
tara:strand:+ start:173 stop:562 length:390 start_codon:yes stop_codon:yes gene_type:complete